MPIPTLITDLSTTLSSNSPAGSDTVFPDLDNYVRALSGFLASIRDNSGNGWVSPYATAAAPTITGTATFTGTASMNAASVRPASAGDGNFGLSANGTGQTSIFSIYNSSVTSGQLRWQISKSNVAESGSNAGSNLSISCFTDAGSALSTPISIVRSTGQVSFSVTPAVGDNSTKAATTAYADRAAFTGATWQNVVGSRAKATNYTNSTGRPIVVSILVTGASAGDRAAITVDSVNAGYSSAAYAASAAIALSTVVPAGGVYRLVDVVGTCTLSNWNELTT